MKFLQAMQVTTLLVVAYLGGMPRVEAQQCDIDSLTSNLDSSSVSKNVKESVWTPFHKNCTNDIAYGNAFNVPTSERTCALTQVSNSFNTISMNACLTSSQQSMEEFQTGCSAQQGVFCTTSAIVTGQISQTPFGSPQFTYINISCLPTCLPSDCTVADNEEAVLNYVKEDVIQRLLQDQGFVVHQLDGIVPLVQCNGQLDGSQFTQVFTTLDDNINEQFYQIGNAVSLALAVFLVVTYMYYVISAYFQSSGESSVSDVEQGEVENNESQPQLGRLQDEVEFDCDKEYEVNRTSSLRSDLTSKAND